MNIKKRKISMDVILIIGVYIIYYINDNLIEITKIK